MASAPSFNPNIPSQRISDVVRNRAITDEYEPGSTFKLVTAAAALEEKIVFPEQKFSGMNGAYKVGSSVISDVHPLGIVSFREATWHSSNVVFSQVSCKIPHNTFINIYEILDLLCSQILNFRVKQEGEFQHQQR